MDFGPFLGPNEPFRRFSHHILCPTGPMKEYFLRYPPFKPTPSAWFICLSFLLSRPISTINTVPGSRVPAQHSLEVEMEEILHCWQRNVSMLHSTIPCQKTKSAASCQQLKREAECNRVLPGCARWLSVTGECLLRPRPSIQTPKANQNPPRYPHSISAGLRIE